ncbi:uncharacterized protein KY384_006794 [Bacidia gigantensis]|uniref:uncharacterized protein n=1 Tax=Bacidia gigantensis TaxID=2732470 RepID=UPI001D041C1F|nr:uncharacterized protein KY384_006794 [Bacidia gigantensis]KAG8527878.1 hypothetical protein KY384_006794 [Bacidia gigantensis]
MSLLEELKGAFSAQKNHQGDNFISYKNARQIVTQARIHEWSKAHPLCEEHGHPCPQRSDLVLQIQRGRIFIFVIIVFANLEFLTKRVLASHPNDAWLFDNPHFERLCHDAGLNSEQKEKMSDCRRWVGAILADRVSIDIPRGVVLPFLERKSLNLWGSYGLLFQVKIAGQHHRNYSHDTIVAEKYIRPSSDATQADWERLFREVQTLQKRRNHPNIIPLLASYTTDTAESGLYVKTLHLLFPLAEMDLADWMTRSQSPESIVDDGEIAAHLYRSIYGLVSSVAYLHKDIDGKATAHHDLKPRNVLVVDGILKLADFGHSHLRPLIEGSATEATTGLGTYEYQPPEYWNEDGSRAEINHGRAFDIWSLGCIIIELAILIVHHWRPQMVNKFREERKANPNKDRRSPRSVPAESDISFHNNTAVVKDWLKRLKDHGRSQQLDKILGIAAEMLAIEPKDRPYTWEIQMDLYDILKPSDDKIPELKDDLCLRPPFKDQHNPVYSWRMTYNLRPDIQEYTDTPLHRAARKNNRRRIIRLWELGWPISLPNSDRHTPRDIMKRSNNVEVQKLEEDVTRMLQAARSGDIEEIKKLFSKGMSPLLVNANGLSALHEAISYSQIRVIEWLLESKAKEQIEVWHERHGILELPLHKAARIGFTQALDRLLKYYPDINISKDSYDTALFYATRYGHPDAVRILLENGALVLTPILRKLSSGETPLHAAPECGDLDSSSEIMQRLLNADDGHDCMERIDGWGMTPLLRAVEVGNLKCVEILIQQGASIHAVKSNGFSFLHMAAMTGRHQILSLCINGFSLSELEGGEHQFSPLETAEEAGHKEVAKMLKSRIHKLGREESGSLKIMASIRKGFQGFKGR